MTTTPEAPSIDPRWQQRYVARNRADAAELTAKLGPDVLDAPAEGLILALKEYGVTQITEDLVYILWAAQPIFGTFVVAHTMNTCGGGEREIHHVMAHVTDGLDFAGAVLLRLEQRIGEEI